PDAAEAVRLQFHPHLDVVGLRAAAGLLLHLLRSRQDAEQILDVMSDLMRDHICLRKFALLAATGVEARFHFSKERRVKKDAAIEGTIEWPHRRLCEAAGGLRRAGEKAQPRRAVLLSVLREDVGP